jgi:hypothetical protein
MPTPIPYMQGKTWKFIIIQEERLRYSSILTQESTDNLRTLGCRAFML